MSRPSKERTRLTPELLLRAYAAGIFPMAESRDDSSVFWVDPKVRGVFPLDGFHVPRSLRKAVRRGDFEIRCDTAFDQVVECCASTTASNGSAERQETWINNEIQQAYGELNRRGFAHSVECWLDGILVGGLYGVSLGGAFFGESMFTHRTNASKIALVHLVARMRLGGYRLLDTQFVTEHLRQFGAVELSARMYQVQLEEAIGYQAAFIPNPEAGRLHDMLDKVLSGV